METKTDQPLVQTPENLARAGRLHTIKVVVITIIIFSSVLAAVGAYYFNVMVPEVEEAKQTAEQDSTQDPAPNPAAHFQIVKPIDAKETVFADISWNGEFDTDYVVRKIAYGKFEITQSNLPTNSLKTPFYEKGEVVNGVNLSLDITTHEGACLPLKPRIYREDESVIAPLNRQLNFPGSGGCGAKKDVTYTDVEIFFPFNESETKFYLDNGEELVVNTEAWYYPSSSGYEWKTYEFSVQPDKSLTVRRY